MIRLGSAGCAINLSARATKGIISLFQLLLPQNPSHGAEMFVVPVRYASRPLYAL